MNDRTYIRIFAISVASLLVPLCGCLLPDNAAHSARMNISVEDHPSSLTDQADTLCTLRFEGVLLTVREPKFDELRVTIRETPDAIGARTHNALLRITDHNGNGFADRGDAIEVVERENVFFADHNQRTLLIEVHEEPHSFAREYPLLIWNNGTSIDTRP